MNNLQKLALALLGTATLVACGSGGGSSGGSTPLPTPSPTPSPSSLQPLVFTQDTLNIDKIGQHRVWHLTVRNPNSVAVNISGNLPESDGRTSGVAFFEIDPSTPYGPSNVIKYAIGGGDNNCLDVINRKDRSAESLKAGQSCTYTFNAMWAFNNESTTQFAFKLRYMLSEFGNNNNYGVVENNCNQQSYQCLGGTNNPITYNLLNVTQKVSGINPVLIDQISLSGNYLWNQPTDAAIIQRKPLTYNQSNNTLTIGSANYSYNKSGIGQAGLRMNYNGDIAYSGSMTYGSTVSDYYNTLPEQQYFGSGTRTVVGMNGVVYSNWGSLGIDQFEYMYPLDTATNTISSNNRLPDPVKFDGVEGEAWAIDTNSNVFGNTYVPNSHDTGMLWGCYVKNGIGYNNFVEINSNGLYDINPANYGASQYFNGYYASAKEDGYYNIGAELFAGETGGVVLNRWNLLDFSGCQASTTNYLAEPGFVFTGNYVPNSKFVLVYKYVNEDIYILPASMMSNGLDGQ